MSGLELQVGDVVTHADSAFPGRFLVVRLNDMKPGVVAVIDPNDEAIRFTLSRLTLVARPLRANQTLLHRNDARRRWSTGPACLEPPSNEHYLYTHADGIPIEWNWKVRANVPEHPAGRGPSKAELIAAGILPLPNMHSPTPRRMLMIDRLGFERIAEFHGGVAHYVPFRDGNRHGEARFDHEGFIMRGDEELIVFREQASRTVSTFEPATAPKKPSLQTLARALFETDPAVVAFVAKVADSEISYLRKGIEPPPSAPPNMAAAMDPARTKRAMQKAWERNEGGWRHVAEVRAANVLLSL